MLRLIPRNFILAKLLLGIVIFFGIFLLMPTKTAMAQDWLEDFDYRRPVIVTNTTTTQSNYQVLVTLDTSSLITAGKMRSDCGDIRITDSDATTTRDYWLESGCNTTSTRLWVEVPNIPAGTTTIFAYYSSSTATSESNGSSTFVFFDDFTGTTIDTGKWTETDGGSNISQDDKLKIANGTGAWTTTGLYSNSNFDRADSLVAQAKYKSTCAAGASYHDTTMLMWKNTGTSIDHPNFIYAFYFNKKVSGNPLLLIYEGGTGRGYRGKFACNTQYWIRQILKTNAGATTQISTNESNWSLLYDSTTDTTASLKVGFTHYQGGEINIDDFLIRKYVSPEPTTEVEGEIAHAVCCQPPISGDHTIANGCSCSFGNGAAGIYGVEEGNLTIEEGATVTIQAGQTLVWTPGYTVFVDGYVMIDKGTPGGQGRKGYLWMTDGDSDDYPATTSQCLGPTSGLPPPTEDCPTPRRRKEMSTMTEVDSDENNACDDGITIHLCGYDDGSGNCLATTSGWHDGLTACEECDGSSIDPVYSAKGTQRTGCTGNCYFCDGSGSCASCGWIYVGSSWGTETYAGSKVYCNNINNDNTTGYRGSSAPACTDTSVYSSHTNYIYGGTYYQLTCQCQ